MIGLSPRNYRKKGKENIDYFGFSGAKLNLHDISSKYNISYANASRIIRMTLYKLRLKMNNNGYYDRIK